MLPAISANLPAYLLPPQTASEGRGGSADPGFGPAVRVEVTGASAIADRHEPAGGLYGPNGQFVERAAGRTAENPLHEESAASRQQTDGASAGGVESERTTDTAAAHPRSDSARAAETAPRPEADVQAASSRARQLTLKQVEAVIPPAARSELVDLADRLKHRSDTQRFDAADYKQIARLMHRVGRYVDAYQARVKAAELQNGAVKADDSGDESESPPPAASAAESDETQSQTAD